ncbi:alpha/beta hydrolase family protein [Sphingobacterium sp. UBA5670]|uniref:alpha/beta hydrolase family protein n=1 Tax=Sphingobacterium sp. UBA5670 TaxID=1947502 RepID=UPI0025D0602E|nr:alpha/beta hydrolase [Sphingobacterium sp. UBA5670]
MAKSKSPLAQQKSKVDMEKYIYSGKHWSELKFFDHILMDALLKHIFGLMQYKMTDFSEIMETLGQMESSSERDWAVAWGNTAKKVQDRADHSYQNNKTVSASSAYLRSASYWRIALMCFSEKEDPIVVDFSKNSEFCYEKYLELSDYPGVKIQVPYEETFLNGYFYQSPVAGEKAPLIIITPGRDTWGEDAVWVFDSAIKRGVHCIVIEGPGQGKTLRLQGLIFRKDWEKVITPVIDYAETLSGIDMERIAILGISFGGYLVPRAAAFDKRIKLCITNPGNISWGDSINNALRQVQKLPKILRPSMMDKMVEDYAWKHGVENEIDAVIDELDKYSNADILDEITCKVLVMDGTSETLPGEAIKFYDALKSPKHYMLFDETTTAQTHTQMGGYATASEILFDWIEDNL